MHMSAACTCHALEPAESGESRTGACICAHLRGGEALEDRDAGDHLQHDHGEAVDVAGASDAPVVQHLPCLVRHGPCSTKSISDRASLHEYAH